MRRRRPSDWPTTLAVFAAGNGRRLSTRGVTSKAMFRIAGRPLISFIFEEALRADMERLVLITRHQDTELRFFARSAGFKDVEFAYVPPVGTLQAVAAATRLAGDEPILLSTCDFVGRPGSVEEFLTAACPAAPAALVVFSAGLNSGDTTPIWIDPAADGYVRSYGKALSPTGLASGSIRLCRRGFASAVANCMGDHVQTESQLMAELIRTHERAAGYVRTAELMDVDTQRDVKRALQLITGTEQEVERDA